MDIKLNMQSQVNDKETMDKFKEVLFKSVVKMHELAVINCPVDTGRLRNSIFFSPSSSGYENYIVSDGVVYGVFVEYGTGKMSMQPFMRPAFDQVKNIWVKRYMMEVFKK